MGKDKKIIGIFRENTLSIKEAGRIRFRLIKYFDGKKDIP
jgi:hypothetical protein